MSTSARSDWGQGTKAVQRVGRALQIALQEQGPPQHRQRVGHLLHVADAIGSCLCIAQHGHRRGVVRGVAQHRAVHDGDARLLRFVAAGQRRGPTQPLQGTLITATQKFDVTQLTAGRRCERGRGVLRYRQRFERRARLHVEFAPEQLAAGGGLGCSTDAVARSGQAAHEQRLVVFVQRVLAHQPPGQIGGLRRRLKVPTLGGEPDFERRAARKIHAFEQFAVESGHAHCLGPSPQRHHRNIHISHWLQRKFQRIAAQTRMAQQAPELAQVPAQRGQGIVSVLEQQPPDLVAARRGQGLAVLLHPRRAEKVNRQAHEAALFQCLKEKSNGIRLQPWSGQWSS
jgi:hypothetical protein